MKINNNKLKADLFIFACSVANVACFRECKLQQQTSDFMLVIYTNGCVLHCFRFDYRCRLKNYVLKGDTSRLTSCGLQVAAAILDKAKRLTLLS